MAPNPSDSRASSGEPSKKARFRTGRRVLVSLMIAAAFVWLLSRGGFPLLPPSEDLRHLSLTTLLGFVVVQLLATFLRTYRWVYLLRPIAPGISTRRVIAIGFVGAAAIFFAPLRMGELVRPYLLAEDGDVSFMQATGSAFAERVIDGLFLTISTATALSLAHAVSPLPTSLGALPLPLAAIPAAVYSATAAFIGLLVAMVAFYAARDSALRLTRWVFGWFSKGASDWATSTLERLADGLSFLPSRRNFAAFLAFTAAYWGCAFFAQWLVMRSTGLDATPAQAVTTFGVVGLGSVVPAGPGMFGAYQIAGFSALAMFFPLSAVRTLGAVTIFVSYLSHLLINALQLLTGFALLLRRPTRAAE